MVNNLSFRVGVAHSFFFFLLISFFSYNSVFAQKVSKHLNTKSQGDYVLFFIDELDTFKQGKKSFDYDITYLSNKDSLDVNFTFTDRAVRKVDRLVFVSENDSEKTESEVKKLVISSAGKEWNHRYNSRFDYDEIVNIIQEPFEVIVFYEDGETRLQLSSRKARKTAALFDKIFKEIESNL
ncbi:MAG: hypothetical protein ACQESK_08385 [Bacteroidota bacterium]